MYAWLWKHLPGPLAVRVIQCVLLAAVVVVVLFMFVFPWLEGHIRFDDTQVDQQSLSREG